MRELRQLLIVLLLAAFVAGCGGGTKPGTYSASGVITDADEQPVEAVVLHFSGGYGTAQTNVQGKWTKSGLSGEVEVTPVKEGYVFTPASQTVSPTFARQVTFLGEAASLTIAPTSVTLQVDETQEFVASGRDKYGQPVPVDPEWLVTGGIGLASPSKGESTIFTATAPGEGTVVAEDGDMVVYAIIKVVPRRESYDIDVTHKIASTPVANVGGKIGATIDDETYDYGIVVTLTATPDDGWRFVRWEGEVESTESTVEVVVIDPEREPIHPFGAGSSIVWRWPPPPAEPTVTYHPDIVAYGDTLTMPMTRTEVGEALEAKFVVRSIKAVFEKEY